MIAVLIIGGCVVAFAVVIGIIAVILDRDDARGTVPVYTFAPAAVDATPRGPAAGAEGNPYRPDPGILSPYHPPWWDKTANVPAAAPSDRQWSGNSDPGETPDGSAAGTPGPVGLPEGDTPAARPPQETTGPGNLPPITGHVVYHATLLQANAANWAAVKALPIGEYLGQLEDETAYTDERPFTDYLRDSVVMPAVRP